MLHQTPNLTVTRIFLETPLFNFFGSIFLKLESHFIRRLFDYQTYDLQILSNFNYLLWLTIITFKINTNALERYEIPLAVMLLFITTRAFRPLWMSCCSLKPLQMCESPVSCRELFLRSRMSKHVFSLIMAAMGLPSDGWILLSPK